MNLSIIDFDLMDGEIFRSEGDRLGYFDYVLKEHIDKLYSDPRTGKVLSNLFMKYIS